MRRVAVVIFYLSGILLVLHNATPHWHGAEFTSETDESDPSALVEFLQFLFQADPGSGHLEFCSQDNPGNEDFGAQIAPQTSTAIVHAVDLIIDHNFVINATISSGRQIGPGPPAWLDGLKLRGPPPRV